MKLKKEYVILLLVIVALALYLVLKDRDASKTALIQPPEVESSRVDRIVITRDGDSVELIQKDAQWILQPQGYPADPALVTPMLDTISKLRLTVLISETGNYERYDLMAEDKILVQGYSGSSLIREFDVGQVAPTFRHTFVKLAGDPNVYHAQGAFKNHFDQTIASLRDKSVFTFEITGISEVEIQKAGLTLNLTKKEKALGDTEQTGDDPASPLPKTEWRNDDGEQADQDELERLMSALAGLKCEDYLNDRTQADYQAPRWSVTFKDAGGAYTLSVYDKADEADSDYPAVSSTSAYVFTLPGNRVDTFEKQLDALVQPAEKE